MNPTALYVPDITDDMSTLDAALAYANAGWYVLPTDPAKDIKNPGTVVGKKWQDKSSRDPKQIAAWFAGTSYGIALHCGRSGAVVFDVDQVEHTPQILRAHLDGAPYQSSRPNDLGRGHYIFRQPAGRKIGNRPGKLGDTWGEVRGANGVIIAAPTPHKDGGEYVWRRTGPVPVLADEIAQQIEDVSPSEDAATDAEIRAFLDQHTVESRPGIIAGRVNGLAAKIETGASRHKSTVPFLTGALEEARAGYYTAQSAVDAIKPVFMNAVQIGENTRTDDAAEDEWCGILAWTVAQANASNIDDVRARVEREMPDDNLDVDVDEEPIPLTHTVPIPPFPVDALPGLIEEMVCAVAEATQTNPAMAATSALSALAACVGGRVEIQIRRGWEEPMCLYTATVAAPGERKSAVQQIMIRPILDTEAKLAEAGAGPRIEAETRKQVAVKAAEQTRNLAAKAEPGQQDKAMAEAIGAAMTAESITVPPVPRLVADDITPEAVASLLAEQGGRLAVISAEGGIFDIIAGQYSKVPNLDVWLKGHAGDPLKVDRKGRDAEYIRRPALTLGLMIQPTVLSAIAAHREFRGRGLLARFLYAYPVSKVGRRRISPPCVDPGVEQAYHKLVGDLAATMAAASGEPAVLSISDKGHQAICDIEAAVEPTLAGDGELASLADWGLKYVGAVARIAGILHLTEHGADEPVTASTVLAAYRIGEYYKACAINAFVEMGADAVTADAVYLLDRIDKLGVDEMSQRDLQRACKSRFRTKARLTPALERLVEHGYLFALPKPAPTGGRPASPRYKVSSYWTKGPQGSQDR